jgi:hypothetical protein
MGQDQKHFVTAQRWNPETNKMEDWYPGKCCPKTTFHTYWQCVNFKGYPTQNYSYEYKPAKPFDGLDRKKWPHTFITLMLFYYNPEWYKMTRWVSDYTPFKGQHHV